MLRWAGCKEPNGHLERQDEVGPEKVAWWSEISIPTEEAVQIIKRNKLDFKKLGFDSGSPVVGLGAQMWAPKALKSRFFIWRAEQCDATHPMPSHRWCETLGHASHHHKPEHEKVPELRVAGQLTGGWLDPKASNLRVPALALLRPSEQRCSGCGGHRTQVGRPCCGVSWSSVGPDIYLLHLSSHCSSSLYRPSDATFLAQTSPNSMFTLTFLSPLFGAAKLRATCLYPKSQAKIWTSKATSACCHLPPIHQFLRNLK